jgi:hypothetical protein
MLSPTRAAPSEGWSSWLAIAGIVVAMLGFDAWVVLGGKSPGRVPGSLSESPILTLQAGQTSFFKPGRMDEGSVIACQNDGLTVAAAVPAPGHARSRHVEPPLGISGATITVVHRADDSVSARCSR